MIVTFKGVRCTGVPGETVLECLERHGVDVSSACRAGVCQSCVLRAVNGDPPAAAQAGLSRALAAGGHFLACRAVVGDGGGALEVAPPGAALATVTARLVEKQRLAPDIMRVRLRCDAPFAFRGGQFVQLVRADGLVRSFSLASLAGDGWLELHVRRVAGGAMSAWIHDTLSPDDVVTVRGPAGECFYDDAGNDRDRPWLLAGTGTGAAPLWALLRDALAHGHRGRIELFHGGAARTDLYLDDAIREVASFFPNLRYTPVIVDERARLEDVVLARVPDARGFKVALAGAPSTVRRLQAKLYIAGALLEDIASDAFVPSQSAQGG